MFSFSIDIGANRLILRILLLSNPAFMIFEIVGNFVQFLIDRIIRQYFFSTKRTIYVTKSESIIYTFVVEMVFAC